jgi:replicative DNA helicase
MTAADSAVRDVPHSLPAEVSLLGSVLLDPDLIRDGTVALLQAEQFYSERHQVIWRTMQSLEQENHPIDLTTLSSALSRQGQLEQAGGLSYLVGLGEQVPTSAHAEHYALILQEQAHLRALLRHTREIQRHIYAGSMALEDLQAMAATPPALELIDDDGLTSLTEALAEVVHQVESGSGPRGVPTGLQDLDQQLNGLEPGRLYVLAARPGVGKSALAFQIAAKVASTGRRALGFSLEMPAMEISSRILSSESRVGLERLTKARRGERSALTARDHERIRAAQERLRDIPFQILPKPSLRLHELMADVRRAHERDPLSLFVLDYVQLVQLAGRGGDNATARVTEVTNALKRLALELNIPVLALSQLSRSVEGRADRRPQLSDLRDSGSLEQDADVVMFLYRDEYYNTATDQQGVCEIIISKNRSGPTATIKVQFSSAYVSFRDMASERDSQPYINQER